MASLLLPATILAAVVFAGKSLKEKLERVSVTNLRVKIGSLKINEVLLKVTLDVYNPNKQSLKFGYFQGYIYRNGIRLGRFDFTDDKNNYNFPGQATTPVTFNVYVTTSGLVANLFNILKNINQHKPADLTFSIDGIMNISGFDVPIKYSYNLKNAISGIGKPYAKMEFGSNEEMKKYFNKDCSDQKIYFSKN